MSPLKLGGNVLVDHQLLPLINTCRPQIVAYPEDIQPSSIDLRVGKRVWQVAGTPPLEKGFRFEWFTTHYTYNTFCLTDFPTGLTLARGSTYLVELDIECRLPPSLSGCTNPKSSAGRIDLDCVVVAEGAMLFDTIPAGYTGRLWLLVEPQSFPVRMSAGIALVQMRIIEGIREFLRGYQLEILHDRTPLVGNGSPVLTQEGLMLHLNLKLKEPAFVANQLGRPIPLNVRRVLKSEVWFRRKPLDNQGCLILEKDLFCLTATWEGVCIPNTVCAEMVPYAPQHGKCRTHYAGFCDPGFGLGSDGGNLLVCEMRNLGDGAAILAHQQSLCQLKFEHLSAVPEQLYGNTAATEQSNYGNQHKVLFAKFFIQR